MCFHELFLAVQKNGTELVVVLLLLYCYDVDDGVVEKQSVYESKNV